MADKTRMKTIGFRATDETITQVAELTELLGREFGGMRMTRSQAVALAVREALDRRKGGKKGEKKDALAGASVVFEH